MSINPTNHQNSNISPNSASTDTAVSIAGCILPGNKEGYRTAYNEEQQRLNSAPDLNTGKSLLSDADKHLIETASHAIKDELTSCPSVSPEDLTRAYCDAMGLPEHIQLQISAKLS